MRVRAIVPTLTAALVSGAAAWGGPAGPVAFPDAYRSWTHTKSMVVQEGHFLYKPFGGIHHIYASPQAVAALRANTPCPDGSVLVLDVLAARPDANAILEGPRVLLAVMVKDSKRFAKTGGWAYEVFKGDTRAGTITDGGAQCHACHKSRKSHDHVFHEWRP